MVCKTNHKHKHKQYMSNDLATEHFKMQNKVHSIFHDISNFSVTNICNLGILSKRYNMDAQFFFGTYNFLSTDINETQQTMR